MNLVQAVKYFGSRNKIAKLLGIRRQAITRWKNGIPVRRQYELEELTEGRLKRSKG